MSLSPTESDHDPSDDGLLQSDQRVGDNIGDYSTRMEELFEEGESDLSQEEDGNGDEGDFVYTGVDASDVYVGYAVQLRDVLGSELTDDDEMEAHEVERSLMGDESAEILHFKSEDNLQIDTLPDLTSSASSVKELAPQRIGSLASKLAGPYLHPAVSRLRSYPPPASSLPPNNGVVPNSPLYGGMSPSPSHFSSISRMSSSSDLYAKSSSEPKTPSVFPTSSFEGDAFKWTELRGITEDMYRPVSQKLSSVLGAPLLGTPTVLAANGLICIGTDEGKVCVYDFKQTLKCICGGESSAKTVGAVTALALSHDHTYVASGHVTGHIQLYDLKNPQSPVRSVPPTTLATVASGRKEGHIQGSRIISIGFVAGRHTVVVSADDHGLAFSHNLGKILFIEASDITRILGKYQEDNVWFTPSPQRLNVLAVKENEASIHDTSLPQRRKMRYSILDMVPLPLGTSAHATDVYNIVALLTPTKLVVVGLKPTPRTWFKCMREFEEGGPWKTQRQAKFQGTLAWYPSLLPRSASKSTSDHGVSTPSMPLLVYTWGSSLHIIRVTESRVKRSSQNPRTGKINEVDVARIVHENIGTWSAKAAILAVEWLNSNQVIVLTATDLQVYDVHASKVVEQIKLDSSALIRPTRGFNSTLSHPDSVDNVSGSFRVYKGKLFLLGRSNISVGTLLTWADRILSFVEDGDFLSGIDLARAYYIGDAPGNRNGLPENPDLRREVIGQKMRDLMVASAKYAFSEDRMTDGTHVTPDGRGVDRTALFENFVVICCKACVALNDFEFLFEDLFQRYDEAGISKIYLQQLEPFILKNEIRYIPPRITQRLIYLHEDDGDTLHVERIIWHIDPACLDINQAIHLCQKYGLYDALIYVYTRALHDCVAPIVELLGLIRKVQLYRRSKLDDAKMYEADATTESFILNAYKIYPYLSNILSGLSYPSGEPLSDDEAYHAKKDVYSFLFSGRSSIWPPGEGARLVLTSTEDGALEPTYPYVRQLLSFDSESFLHSLDIAFEDSHLNDESRGASRLVIVTVLLEILSSGDLPRSDVTFVNIFIARNVPKYPQFLQVAPTALHGILIGLADEPDPDTREDRQLAAEYLLSAYNPHESERIVRVFRSAGFYRILRSWYRHERRWAYLASAYLDDPGLRNPEIFDSLDDILTISTRSNQGRLPIELIDTVSHAIPRLLDASLTSTAVLIDKHAPNLHEVALHRLDTSDQKLRFLYLQHLLNPHKRTEYEENESSLHAGPSINLSHPLRQLYISLQCQYGPREIVEVLKRLPQDFLNWDEVLNTCEANHVYDAIIWVMNSQGHFRNALAKAEAYQYNLTLEVVEAFNTNRGLELAGVRPKLESLEHIVHMGIAICVEHTTAKIEIPIEETWLQLLSSQIRCVQVLSGPQPKRDFANLADSEWKDKLNNVRDQALTVLRTLVQTTFAALVSVTSSRAVSFPRLFERLVTSASTFANTQYTEFRVILTWMLESYRSDGDMLLITKHLIDRDLFQSIANVTRERDRGWSPSQSTCLFCQKPLFGGYPAVSHQDGPLDSVSLSIVVSRIGTIYHSRCLPPKL